MLSMRVYRVHDNDGGGEQHVPTFIKGYNNIYTYL